MDLQFIFNLIVLALLLVLSLKIDGLKPKKHQHYNKTDTDYWDKYSQVRKLVAERVKKPVKRKKYHRRASTLKYPETRKALKGLNVGTSCSIGVPSEIDTVKKAVSIVHQVGRTIGKRYMTKQVPYGVLVTRIR